MRSRCIPASDSERIDLSCELSSTISCGSPLQMVAHRQGKHTIPATHRDLPSTVRLTKQLLGRSDAECGASRYSSPVTFADSEVGDPPAAIAIDQYVLRLRSRARFQPGRRRGKSVENCLDWLRYFNQRTRTERAISSRLIPLRQAPSCTERSPRLSQS